MEEVPESLALHIASLRALIKRAEARGDEAHVLALEHELYAAEGRLPPDVSPDTVTPHALLRKLFIPRMADGSAQYELLDLYRELDTELAESFYCYAGLIPVGSQITGYAKARSDIDIRLILDINIRDYDSCCMYLETDFVSNFKNTYNKEPHVLISDISMSAIKQYLTVDAYNPLSHNAAEAVVLVMQLVVGKEFVEYRRLAVDLFTTLPESLKKQILHSAISKILHFESNSLSKIKATVGPHFDERDHLQHRRSLWERRAHLLGFLA